MEGVRSWEETRRRAQAADKSVLRRSGGKTPDALPVYKKNESLKPKENATTAHVRLIKSENAKRKEEPTPVARKRRTEFVPEKIEQTSEVHELLVEDEAGEVPENLPVVEDKNFALPDVEDLPLQKDLPQIEKEGVKNIGGRKAARAEFGYGARLERGRGRREGVRPPKKRREIRTQENKLDKEKKRELYNYKKQEKQTIEERLDAVRQRVEDDLALDKRRRNILSHVLDGTFSDISVRDFFYDVSDKDFTQKEEENTPLFQKNKQRIENLKKTFAPNEKNISGLLAMKEFFKTYYEFVRGWGNQDKSGIAPQTAVVEQFFSLCERISTEISNGNIKYSLRMFLEEGKRKFKNKQEELEIERKIASRYGEKRIPLKEKYLQAYQQYLSSLESIIASL